MAKWQRWKRFWRINSLAAFYARADFRALAGDVWRPGGLALTRKALELCAFPPRARLLDCGCGAGATLRHLQASGFACVGMDLAPTRQGMDLSQVCADACKPPFADHVFDGIICECVLSLLAPKERVLRQCARMLKPGGKLILADIYDRGATHAGADGTSCIAGAIDRFGLEDLLAQAGFAIRHFSDHSRELAQLAARLVWHGIAPSEICGANARCSSGYALWIAALA